MTDPAKFDRWAWRELAWRRTSGLGDRVATVLTDHANDDGQCWPGWDTICKRTHGKRRSVAAWLQRLRELGLIKVEQQGNGRPALITLQGCRGADITAPLDGDSSAAQSAPLQGCSSAAQECTPDSSAGVQPGVQGCRGAGVQNRGAAHACASSDSQGGLTDHPSLRSGCDAPPPAREASALVPSTTTTAPVLAGRPVASIVAEVGLDEGELEAATAYAQQCYIHARVERCERERLPGGYDQSNRSDIRDALVWLRGHHVHAFPDPHNPTWEDAGRLLGLTMALAVTRWKTTERWPLPPRARAIVGRGDDRDTLLRWLDHLQVEVERHREAGRAAERRQQTEDRVRRSVEDARERRAEEHRAAAAEEAECKRPEGEEDAAARRAAMEAILGGLRGAA